MIFYDDIIIIPSAYCKQNNLCIRRRRNRKKEPGRRLDDFGRDAPSREPAGFLTLTQQKRRSAKALRLFWRKVRDYLRRRRNRKKELCRRLDDFGRSAPSREPAGFLTLTQQKRRSAKAPRLFWRKVRDSNPRMLAHQRFSRPPRSTAPPTFRIEIAGKNRQIFYFRSCRDRPMPQAAHERKRSIAPPTFRIEIAGKNRQFFYFRSCRDRPMPQAARSGKRYPPFAAQILHVCVRSCRSRRLP